MKRLTDDVEKIKDYLDKPGTKIGLASTQSKHIDLVIQRLVQIMPKPKTIKHKSHIKWENGSELFIFSALNPGSGRGYQLNAVFVFEPRNLGLIDRERQRDFYRGLSYIKDCQVYSYSEL